VAEALVLVKLESELFTPASAIATASSIVPSYALRRSRFEPRARSIALLWSVEYCFSSASRAVAYVL
jgi:hypothetical protein